MTTRPVVAKTTLDSLRKQAKAILKAVKAGDASAMARIAPYFGDPHGIGLQDIHLVLAREQGFSSWTRLKAALEAKDGKVAADRLANRFLSLVTLSYFSNIPADPARFEEAGALLAEHPGIADDSIHVAAAIGDADRLAGWLDRQPQLLERKGGPYDWPPLLYAAYARLPGRSSLPAARALIARGADPNAFFLDQGQYRFTALTGVFGQGEAGRIRQPEHPDMLAFATLLLDAGAEANDSQALYNRMFEPDDTCLALLLKYGLSADDRNNWLVREDGNLTANSQTVFDYQLAFALEKRMPERVRLLAAHGADLTRAVHGRTPYEWARLGGDEELASYLVARGASAVDLQPEDLARIRIADAAFPLDELAGWIGRTTGIEAIQRRHPAMLHEAAGENDLQTARRMLALGFDPNAMTSRTPLHEAALHGHIEMAALLIDHGADPRRRDPHHYAPPIGWADYNGQTEMVDFLLEKPLDVFTAAAFGRIASLRTLLDADPALIEARFADHRPPGRAEPGRDWMTPLGFAIVNGRAECVRFLVERGANRQVRDGLGRGYRELVREAGNADMAASMAGSAAPG